MNSQDPVAGYNIYRSQSGANSFAEINPSLITTTSYTDSAILYGVSYDYYATSQDAAGNQSDPSNISTAVIPFVPSTPVVGVIK